MLTSPRTHLYFIPCIDYIPSYYKYKKALTFLHFMGIITAVSRVCFSFKENITSNTSLFLLRLLLRQMKK